MSDPITWQLVDHIAKRMALIDGSEGWHTEIDPADIHTSRAQIRDNAHLPQMLIQADEVDIRPNQVGNRTQILSVQLRIEYAVPIRADLESERLAHRALADIRRALLDAKSDAPFRIHDIKVSSCSVLPDASGAHSIIAFVTAQAGVSEPISPA